MTLDLVTTLRNLLGKAAAGICLLLVLALMDGLIDQFRQPMNLFKVLPGESVEINGPLEEEVRDLRDLIYQSSSPHLLLTFEAVHRGYFLGGNMWRGRVTVGPQIQPGEYPLTVGIRGKPSPKPLPPYRLLVFPDPLSREQSSKSLFRLYLGLSPWTALFLSLPVILAAVALVFFLSQKREQLLAQRGQAEVYHVARKEAECVIHFGLGTAHGVQAGDRLIVKNEQGQIVGTVEVMEAAVTDSKALASTNPKIKPGYLVCLDSGTS